MKIGIVGAGQVGYAAGYSMMMRRVGSEIAKFSRQDGSRQPHATAIIGRLRCNALKGERRHCAGWFRTLGVFDSAERALGEGPKLPFMFVRLSSIRKFSVVPVHCRGAVRPAAHCGESPRPDLPSRVWAGSIFGSDALLMKAPLMRDP
jgi:hypothetical protein